MLVSVWKCLTINQSVYLTRRSLEHNDVESYHDLNMEFFFRII